MPPVPSELHVDRYLTDLSVAFIQDRADFISDKVFPVVPVLKQSDQYVIFNRGDYWRDQVHPRPLGGALDVADWSMTSGTYNCVEQGLAHKVDDRQRANADDPISPDRQAALLLTQAVAVSNDVRWTSEYFGASIWTTDLEGAADADFTQIADTSTGAPIELFDLYKETVRELTAVEPNTLVVGAKVHRILRNHTDVKEVVKYTQTAIIDADLLARMFGISNYFIARAVYNTAAEGAADSFSFISATNDALLCYAAPSPGLETPSAGYTFAWTELLDGQANNMGFGIERGRDAFAHSDHFEIRLANDIKLVSADLGVFFNTIVPA
jgi:hypothetical protein